MSNIQAPDQKYLQKIENIEFQPVFILGLHRSGTTILYKVLTATGCFNPVTTYHIMRYDQLIENHIENKEEAEKNKLTESFKKEGLEDRKVDRMKLTADFEEEYGFLLDQHFRKMNLTPNNVALFQEMCKKIQFIAGNDKPILLKNPFDFSNFLYIKQAFPKAKFVFIHRHPLKTISSNLNAFRMVFEDKNPYTAAISNIYERYYSNPVLLPFLRLFYVQIPALGVMWITWFAATAVKYFLKNIEQLPKDDRITITYEEFCKSPQITMESILDTLSLKMVNKIDASSYINERKVEIDSQVRKMRRSIYSSMKAYFNKFHYTVEEDEKITSS